MSRVALAIARVAPAIAMVWTLAACGTGQPTRAAAVGDSITVLVQDQLAAETDTDWDVKAVLGATAEQMRASAEQLAGTPHDQAVINLGTNDAFDGVPTRTTVEQLGAIIDGFADAQCVHLVTVNAHSPEANEDIRRAAAAINDWLRATAREDARVHVIDWDQAVVDDPGLLNSDGVHPNERGQERLVELLDDAVSSC